MSTPSQRIAGLSPAEKRVLLAQLLRKKAGRAKADFDTEKWPTPTNRSILLMRQEAWDGEESEGGAIRADPEGIRVRHRECKGGGAQAGSTPAHGSTGTG